jgi:hypothetical protein
MKSKISVLAFVVAVSPAWGSLTHQAECTINLTIRPGGPRPGIVGLRFFNAQGAGSGAFASWGVAEFTTASFAIDTNLGPVTDIGQMVLALQSNNASFTRPGDVQAWISRDVTTVVAQTNSAITFLTAPEHLPHGVGTQFDPKIQAGPPLHFPFTGTANSGVTFEIPLHGSLDATTRQFLIDQLNDPNGRFRILVTPLLTDTMAATFSGFEATIPIGDPPVAPFGPTIRFALTQGAARPPQSGTVRFRGRVAGFPPALDIAFRDTATLAVIHTATAPLTATADPEVFSFTIPAGQLPPAGVYNVAAKPGTFLRDSLGARDTANPNTDLDFDLINGNVVDDDNVVDLSDFLMLAAHYETSPLANPNADLNGDGACDLSDFLILAANYETAGDE